MPRSQFMGSSSIHYIAHPSLYIMPFPCYTPCLLSVSSSFQVPIMLSIVILLKLHISTYHLKTKLSSVESWQKLTFMYTYIIAKHQSYNMINTKDDMLCFDVLACLQILASEHRLFSPGQGDIGAYPPYMSGQTAHMTHISIKQLILVDKVACTLTSHQFH